MLNIGLDLHKRETQICIVDASGAIQLERRLPTTRPGKRVAVVAVARRLAGILDALWRDGTSYGARPGQVVSAA
jgi:predicted NBD/HSP70 family sugar kinase